MGRQRGRRSTGMAGERGGWSAGVDRWGGGGVGGALLLAVLVGGAAHALTDAVLAGGEVLLAGLDRLGDGLAPVEGIGVAGHGGLGGDAAAGGEEGHPGRRGGLGGEKGGEGAGEEGHALVSPEVGVADEIAGRSGQGADRRLAEAGVQLLGQPAVDLCVHHCRLPIEITHQTPQVTTRRLAGRRGPWRRRARPAAPPRRPPAANRPWSRGCRGRWRSRNWNTLNLLMLWEVAGEPEG